MPQITTIKFWKRIWSGFKKLSFIILFFFTIAVLATIFIFTITFLFKFINIWVFIVIGILMAIIYICYQLGRELGED